MPPTNSGGVASALGGWHHHLSDSELSQHAKGVNRICKEVLLLEGAVGLV